MASQATELLVEQTLEVLRNGEFVERLARRYANHAVEQRAGHMFELMHALSFNLDAIAQRSDLRAQVTEWAAGGSQNGPVDLQVLGKSGLVSEAQAKLLERTSELASSISDPSYRGMDRIVPADKVADVERILDGRLKGDPGALRYDDYLDARAHLDDRLSAGAVESDPVTRNQALDGAEDPSSWQHRQVLGAAVNEVAAAAAAGAVIGGGITLLISAASEAARFRAHETSAMRAAVTASGSAAKAAVRSGAVAGVGQSLSLAARMGHLPTALSGGTLPYAISNAAFSVGASGLAYARGQIDAAELAAQSASTLTTTTLVWACGVVGQTVIPVPVVGALVGGTVGQVAATVVIQGLRLAIVAGRADRADEERLLQLQDEVAAALEVGASLRLAVAAVGAEHNAYVTDSLLPQLGRLERALTSNDPDAALSELAALTRKFEGQPIFSTVHEFEAWMANPDALLVPPTPETDRPSSRTWTGSPPGDRRRQASLAAAKARAAVVSTAPYWRAPASWSGWSWP
jgi:hypothetical protein